MSKQNLDKLFQEKFKNFSEVPDDKIWQAIETSLDQKKKKRKITPFWWQLSGIAAALVLGISLYYTTTENTNSITPAIKTIVSEDQKDSKKNNSTIEHEIIEDFENSKEAIAVQKEENTLDIIKPLIDKNSNTNSEASKPNPADLTTNTKLGSIKNAADEILKQDGKKNNAAADFTVPHNETTVVVINKEKNDQIISDEIKTENVLAENEEKTTKDESEKTSIYDALAEKEKEVLADNNSNKWSVGPSIAPVYFDATGNGSPVHSIFAPNSKSGELNLSYGLDVAYEVSKKLSLRSGVHKVDFGYSTADVEFSSSLNPAVKSNIRSIDFSSKSSNLVVNSAAGNQVSVLNQNPFLNSAEVPTTTPAKSGSMEQQLGYIEVPLELKYAIIDKRIGFNIIGGVSSLFLVNNSVSLSSGDLITEVGEANNINSVNFSTNIGFGVNYKFTPKLKFNLEPMFKYQMNTFSSTFGTFQPFTVGVYSGLTFKF